MKTTNRIILASALSLLLAMPSVAFAQSRQATGRATSPSTTRTTTTRSASTPSVSNGRQNNTGSSNSRSTVKNSSGGAQSIQSKPASTTTRPTTQTRVINSNNKPSATPPSGGNQSRPSATPPSGGNQNKPSATPPSSGNQNKPSATPPSGGTQSKPNFNSTGRQPSQSSRPGNNTSTNPGANRPGDPTKPGSAPKPNTKPSAPSYRPDVNRPHNNFWRPNYQPPRPNGGFWAAPPVNIYRPSFFRPLPPPRPVTFGVGIPVLNNILGLTFGTFIDLGINTLFNAGYNVLGYANNLIYIGNVNQIGYNWPEATVYYTDGLMSNAQFQYWTTYPSSTRFNNVYTTLTRTYGAPVSNYYDNAVRTVSWWAGGGTGYVTLQYGPGLADNGRTYYYTTLTYSDYF